MTVLSNGGGIYKIRFTAASVREQEAPRALWRLLYPKYEQCNNSEVHAYKFGRIRESGSRCVLEQVCGFLIPLRHTNIGILFYFNSVFSSQTPRSYLCEATVG